MTKYYCEYCGSTASSVAALVAASCPRHPASAFKGKHKLYDGTEKAQYTCKFCGTKAPSIATLIASDCQRHPDGAFKGKHAPALH